jgi:hypothetical protein
VEENIPFQGSPDGVMFLLGASLCSLGREWESFMTY